MACHQSVSQEFDTQKARAVLNNTALADLLFQLLQLAKVMLIRTPVIRGIKQRISTVPLRPGHL
jgi:hypothetical protein